MVDIIKNNLDKIQDACRLMQVQSLYLFGSGARENDFVEGSDIDFLYRPDYTALKIEDSYDNYFELTMILERILSRKIDLVNEKALKNKYLIAEINKDKQLIYAKS